MIRHPFRFLSRSAAAVAATAAALGAAPAATADPGAPGCVARGFGPPPTALRTGAAVTGPPARVPAATTGNIHLLVVLAEFSDLPFRVDPSRFQEQLFGAGPSLRSYYDEVSAGQLDITGDVHGWVTLPQSQGFYSGGSAGVGSYPNNGQKMAEDAVQAAVTGGLDLDAYDADGDGIVDALLVIHSGQGFEWAGTTGPGAPSSSPDPQAINSHKWVVQDGDFGGATRVLDYFTTPELQLTRPASAPAWTDSVATIGVVCHEFGHVLGLPDFYDTSTFDNNLGIWDLMDYGTWNRIATDPSLSAPGALPGHFSAWPKLAMGWTVAAPLTPGVGESVTSTVVLESASADGFPLQLLFNPDGPDWRATRPGSGEYFLAEVRTRTGFDAGLPAEGLLLYHVDESRAGNNAGTNPDGGALLRVLPEDGVITISGANTGDPWPGVQSSFGSDSAPSSRLWDGTESGVALSNIGPLTGGTVTFSAEVVNLAAALPVPFARPNPFDPSVHGGTSIVLSIGSASTAARVRVFDVAGRTVRTLHAGRDFSAGDRVVTWDGARDDGRRTLAGIYFFRPETDGSASTPGRVVLLR